MKTVQVVAHAFDCLPGHVTIAVRGYGSNVRCAVQDALRDLFADRRLYRKQIGDFKLSVVVIADRKIDATVKKGGAA